MVRFSTYYFTAILIIQLLAVKTFSQSVELKTEIEKLIRFDTEIDFKKTPGFLVSIIDNDSTYYFSFGSKIRNEQVEISKSDIFESGSITKVFTASLISILVHEGKLQYTDKVNGFIEEAYRNPRLENLTIMDLVTHQSGMSLRPAFFGKKEKNIQNPYAHYKKEDLLKYYRDYIPESKKFEYSHTNYALLELVINAVTQKSIEDVLIEKIFNPLGMRHSFIDFAEKKDKVITTGYDRSMKPVTPWSFSSFKGSEALKTTAEDLVSFLKANMNMSFSELDNIFNHNFTPQLQDSFNTQLSVAIGWHIINMNHFNIITHTGRTSGHNVFIGMVRETKTAVVILANSTAGTEDLGLQILRMINYNWKRVNS